MAWRIFSTNNNAFVLINKMVQFSCFMEESPLVRLNLRSPLVYAEIQDFPQDFEPACLAGKPAFEQEELLLCFELDPTQSLSIEPEPEYLCGALIFAGRGTDSAKNPVQDAKTVTLPAGKYLFAQRRKALGREEWLNMAIEQQKDGLWERLKPENRLYVRYLFEDGEPVTQLFRPCGAISKLKL